MSLCCGQERSSNYCPDCGKKIPLSPIENLMDYLRANRDRNKNASGCQEHSEQERARSLEIAKKWNNWMVAIVELQEKAS